MRKMAVPFSRSSVVTTVTLLGRATVWCQSVTGEQSNRRESSTHSTPKWQKSSRFSVFGRTTDKVWHELAFGLESLGYDTPTIRRRVAEMASFFGIQTWFYKPVTALSGGQKQLLNLASVMVLQPKVTSWLSEVTVS